MLKYGNKEFRNLQEQVDKNMNDIDWLINYKAAINEFGIKVVGQGPRFSEGTPDPSDYTAGDTICAWADGPGMYLVYFCDEDENGDLFWTRNISVYKEYHEDWEYGDAWVFGAVEPYEMFILTRSNGSNPTDYFLPVGQFPIPGPTGATGATGPVGNTPNMGINIGTVSTLNAGQNATASVSKSGTADEPVFTINFAIPQGAKGNTGAVGPQGPQGIQGPQGEQGEKGEQGGLIEVVGIVEDPEDLPNPETLEKLDAAYLVGTSPDYELYIQVGTTPATAVWTNLGAFNTGSVVTVSGVGQSVWDADTKVSVYTNQLVDTLYGEKSGDHQGQTHIPYGTAATANAIPQRDVNGQITLPETPTLNAHAASKKYVDDSIAAADPIEYQGDIIVGDANGVGSRLAIGSANQMLGVNALGTGLEYKTVTNIPAISTGDGGKVLTVNNAETGVEWGTAGGGGALYEHNIMIEVGATDGNGGKGQIGFKIINSKSTSLTDTEIINFVRASSYQIYSGGYYYRQTMFEIFYPFYTASSTTYRILQVMDSTPNIDSIVEFRNVTLLLLKLSDFTFSTINLSLWSGQHNFTDKIVQLN